MSSLLNSTLNTTAQRQKLNRLLAVTAAFLLILAIASLLADMTWRLFPQPEAEQAAVTRTAPGPQPAARPSSHFRALTAAHLFGETTRPAPVVQTKVPETRLNLTLKGVLAAVPMRQAAAIISEGKQGKENVYGIGDKLKGGVVIKAIHADHVVLERRGKLETLKLPKSNPVGSAAVTSHAPANRFKFSSPSPGRALAHIRQKIIQSPTSFGEYALPVTVKENGKQIGYRLDPQDKGELLTRLGIQEQDIITEVNGVKLDNPRNAVSALRTLSTATILNLKVRRNGSDIPIQINMNK